MPDFLPVHTDAQIEAVAALAHEIWYEHYVPLIGRAQVDYMVQKFQSAAAIREQMLEGYRYYMVCRPGAQDGAPQGVHDGAQGHAQSHAQVDAQVDAQDDALIGYFAVQARPEEDALFISKLYLRRAARGAGTGRACLAFIEQLARQEGRGLVWLTVNKGNPSVQAYEKAGFRIARAVVMDIGNGFVMDDFRMEKPVS